MAELRSPIAGGIRAVRNTVPSSVFSGGAVSSQPDPITANLISQNSMALTSVSQQLENISGRVDNLGKSLLVIKKNLEVNAAIERRREAAKAQRERRLAEQALREGKESQLESKIQNALFSPVRKLAATTKSLLSRLSGFLFSLVGGWITLKTVQILTALSTKNGKMLKDTLGSMVSTLVVGGAILFLTKGRFKNLTGILNVLKNSALAVAAGGILVAGFNALMKLLKRISDFAKDTLGFIGIKLPESEETEEFIPKITNQWNRSDDNVETPNDNTGTDESIEGDTDKTPPPTTDTDNNTQNPPVTSDDAIEGDTDKTPPPTTDTDKKPGFFDWFTGGKGEFDEENLKMDNPWFFKWPMDAGKFLFGSNPANAKETDITSDTSDDNEPSSSSVSTSTDQSSINGVNNKSKVVDNISKDTGDFEFIPLITNQFNRENGNEESPAGAPPPEGTRGTVDIPDIATSDGTNGYKWTAHYNYGVVA